MEYGTIENESDKKILDCVDRLKGRFISSVLELVRIDSVEGEADEEAPFGTGVNRALECALDISGQLGFDTVNLDHYIGYAQYGRGEDYVCAIGHVDVVPAGEGWKQPPFRRMKLSTAGGCWITKGRSWPVSMVWPPLRKQDLPLRIRCASSLAVTKNPDLRI